MIRKELQQFQVKKKGTREKEIATSRLEQRSMDFLVQEEQEHSRKQNLQFINQEIDKYFLFFNSLS